jgi:hypothetical protein
VPGRWRRRHHARPARRDTAAGPRVRHRRRRGRGRRAARTAGARTSPAGDNHTAVHRLGGGFTRNRGRLTAAALVACNPEPLPGFTRSRTISAMPPPAPPSESGRRPRRDAKPSLRDLT